MDDLAAAINEHSHFVGADLDNFWERLWDKYAPEYTAQCRQSNVAASLSDFQVWAEEHDLVPDDEIYG